MISFVKPIKVGILGGILALFVSTLIYYIFTHLLTYFSIPFTEQKSISFLHDNHIGSSSLILFLISVIIISPITEELLFRAILQPFVVRSVNNYAIAISVVATLFSIAHLNMVSAPSLFAASLIFSECFNRSGILSAITSHVTFNLLTVIIILIYHS